MRYTRPVKKFKHYCDEGEECRCEEQYDTYVNQRIDEEREREDDPS